MMKIFVLHKNYSHYESSYTKVLGVFCERDFPRCIDLIKSHLSENAKQHFNTKSFNFEGFKIDFIKVTSTLNCKENNVWDSLNLPSYTKNNDARTVFSSEANFVVECHWLEGGCKYE